MPQHPSYCLQHLASLIGSEGEISTSDWPSLRPVASHSLMTHSSLPYFCHRTFSATTVAPWTAPLSQRLRVLAAVKEALPTSSTLLLPSCKPLQSPAAELVGIAGSGARSLKPAAALSPRFLRVAASFSSTTLRPFQPIPVEPPSHSPGSYCRAPNHAMQLSTAMSRMRVSSHVSLRGACGDMGRAVRV